MNRTLKALGALLGYPDAALRGALAEIAGAIGASRDLADPAKARLAELIGEMAATDPYEIEEQYVALFDRGRATSLHLFEHVHGESRDRGQAMVSLREVYESAGWTLTAGELPDYLPALLEFLALGPDDQALEMLRECAHILRATGEALLARDSLHASVFDALLELAGEPGLRRPKAVEAREPVGSLDEEWAEEPVIFGPAAACGLAGRCTVTAAGPAALRFPARHDLRSGRTP